MEEQKKRIEFRGGMFGLLMPFVVMLAGILYLSIKGNALPMAFWVPTLGGIFIALALAKKPAECAECLIEGIANKTVIMIVVVLIFAGMVAQILKTTGLVEGLTWLCISLGVSGALFPAIVFICGSVLSTATGTALGTVMSLSPVLYPVGIALGSDPALLLGAIVSAAYFGDNIGPVSDTTIASACTQQVPVSKVVRSRLKYAFLGAAIALVLFVLFGFLSYEPSTSVTEVSASQAKGLVMLLVPALLIFLMVRGCHMLVALSSAIVFGLVLGCATGLMQISDILVIDMNAFAVGGTLVDGINGMMDTIIFAMLMMAIVHLLEYGGLFDVMMSKIGPLTNTERKAEAFIGIANIIMNVLTVCNSVVILLLGPVAKKLLTEKFNISRDRAANMLDAVSCAAMCLIPYGFAPMLAFSFAAGSGAPVNCSLFDIALHGFHGYGLFIAMTIAVLTGWGRTHESPAEREAAIARGE